MDDVIVYRHRRLDTFEIFYVGIAKDKRRPYEKKCSRNNLWKNIINKTEYKVEILAENLNWNEACELECLLIKQYGRKDLGLGKLVNMTDGGDGTVGRKYIPTERHKLNLSKSQKGKVISIETRLKISLAQKGRKISDENLKILIKSNTGRIKSIEEREKISKNSKNSKKVICTKSNIIYKSIVECARLNVINYYVLKRKLNGQRNNNTTFKHLIDAN